MHSGKSAKSVEEKVPFVTGVIGCQIANTKQILTAECDQQKIKQPSKFLTLQ